MLEGRRKKVFLSITQKREAEGEINDIKSHFFRPFFCLYLCQWQPIFKQWWLNLPRKSCNQISAGSQVRTGSCWALCRTLCPTIALIRQPASFLLLLLANLKTEGASVRRRAVTRQFTGAAAGCGCKAPGAGFGGWVISTVSDSQTWRGQCNVWSQRERDSSDSGRTDSHVCEFKPKHVYSNFWSTQVLCRKCLCPSYVQFLQLSRVLPPQKITRKSLHWPQTNV